MMKTTLVAVLIAGSIALPAARADTSRDDEAKVVAELRRLDLAPCLKMPDAPTRPVWVDGKETAQPAELLAQINVSQAGAVTAVTLIEAGSASIYGGRASGKYEGTAAGRCAVDRIKSIAVKSLAGPVVTAQRWVVTCDNFNDQAVNCTKARRKS